MSLWNHLRTLSIEKFCQEVTEEGKAIQELHERFKQPAHDEQEGIDLNNHKTQWTLSCDAVGDDRYWGD